MSTDAPLKPRIVVGPCLICGGRPRRNGKREHDPERHATFRARRAEAWRTLRRWPKLRMERHLRWWAKREARTAERAAGQGSGVKP